MNEAAKTQKLTFEDPIRFLHHMPRSGDVELTLLKGHLLVEKILQMLIDRSLRNPLAIRDARFTFRHRLYLAKSLYPENYLEWVWEAAQKLNSVRNEMAHSLDKRTFDQKLKDFVDFVERKQSAPAPENVSPVFGRLHWALFAIHCTLSARLRLNRPHVPTLLGGGGDS